MPATTATPNDLEAYWMPFTANRAFKKAPRMLGRARDMHYFTPDGRKLLDGAAGLWCVNAGHGRDPIVKAIQDQAAEMDYAPPFNFGHPKAFQLATRIAAALQELTEPALRQRLGACAKDRVQAWNWAEKIELLTGRSTYRPEADRVHQRVLELNAE